MSLPSFAWGAKSICLVLPKSCLGRQKPKTGPVPNCGLIEVRDSYSTEVNSRDIREENPKNPTRSILKRHYTSDLNKLGPLEVDARARVLPQCSTR